MPQLHTQLPRAHQGSKGALFNLFSLLVCFPIQFNSPQCSVFTTRPASNPMTSRPEFGGESTSWLLRGLAHQLLCRACPVASVSLELREQGPGRPAKRSNQPPSSTLQLQQGSISGQKATRERAMGKGLVFTSSKATRDAVTSGGAATLQSPGQPSTGSCA